MNYLLISSVAFLCSNTLHNSNSNYDVNEDSLNTPHYDNESSCVEKTQTLKHVEEDLHEYVDLGLSVKWATMNIGASSPEEYGSLFAWGETKAYFEEDMSNTHLYSVKGRYLKRYFDWSTYKWCSGYDENTLTKYNTQSENGIVDNKTTLDLEDDAAYVNWGENWRMPTEDEMNELATNCIWAWTTIDGKNGYKVTSKIDASKYIFLPAAGHRFDGIHYEKGSRGNYWSSSLCIYPEDGCHLYFSSSYVSSGRSCNGRYNGCSVRPVRRQ